MAGAKLDQRIWNYCVDEIGIESAPILLDVSSTGMNNAVDRDAIVCTAIDISSANRAAMILLNKLLFYLGMSSNRHLEAMLNTLSEWEQAVGDGGVGPKQAFRWLIEEKANSWAARR